MERINDVLHNLRSKLRRQQNAVLETEEHIKLLESTRTPTEPTPLEQAIAEEGARIRGQKR